MPSVVGLRHQTCMIYADIASPLHCLRTLTRRNARTRRRPGATGPIFCGMDIPIMVTASMHTGFSCQTLTNVVMSGAGKPLSGTRTASLGNGLPPARSVRPVLTLQVLVQGTFLPVMACIAHAVNRSLAGAAQPRQHFQEATTDDSEPRCTVAARSQALFSTTTILTAPRPAGDPAGPDRRGFPEQIG